MATQTDSWRLTAAQTTGGVDPKPRVPRSWTYTADATADGAFTAQVVIEVRNWATGAWKLYGTMNLSGTGSAVDDLPVGDAPYQEHRARLVASTGSNVVVNVSAAGGA